MTNTNADTTYESVFRALRALMPSRVLTYAEALQRAELQAGRLLSLHGVAKPAMPIEIISELRRNQYDALWVNGHNHATYLIGILAARWLKIPWEAVQIVAVVLAPAPRTSATAQDVPMEPCIWNGCV